jgi:hypothetical protein
MAGNYDIVIEQGATFSLAITVTGIDLTTYTARGQGRTTHASGDKAFTLSTAIAYSLPNSTITVSLTATQTTALTAPSNGVYDVEYVSSSGTVVTRILEGTYTITPEVTR